jgi:hypothetical protein
MYHCLCYAKVLRDKIPKLELQFYLLKDPFVPSYLSEDKEAPDLGINGLVQEIHWRSTCLKDCE